MIYILFGEMGVGKNYVGEQLADHLGYNFFDGDSALPDPLKEKVSNFDPLTLEDVERFVEKNLIIAIESQYKQAITGTVHKAPSPAGGLVVAQALYRAEHRQKITNYFGRDLVEWVYIQPPSIFTHMGRLLNRDNGFKWVTMALLSKFYFQKPTSDCISIKNTDNLNISRVWK